MGYVYTPREFEEGKIPTLLDYQRAMQLLKEGLVELSNQELIYGANIHGSNFHQDSGIGSDIDVIVIMNSQEAEEHLRRLYATIKGSTYVPIEVIPVQKHLAQQGYHLLDYYYVLYMKTYCRDGVVGNDPISIIAPRDTWNKSQEEVRERFEAQLTKLSKRRITLPSEYDLEHCDLLENLIRQPLYAAIDILRIKYGNYPSDKGRPLTKAECCELYSKEFPQLVTPDLFLVLEMRNKYRQFLQDREGKTSDYIQLLEKIDDIYPNARRVIERNLEFLLAHPEL